jgi:hypothetical protein
MKANENFRLAQNLRQNQPVALSHKKLPNEPICCLREVAASEPLTTVSNRHDTKNEPILSRSCAQRNLNFTLQTSVQPLEFLASSVGHVVPRREDKSKAVKPIQASKK